jgi:hypothetical protein
MTILFDASVPVNSNPLFGHGIIQTETPRDRHFRESMAVCDAVAEARAVRIPIDSPRYALFVRAMNQPVMPRGFETVGGSYVPTDAESVWATLDAERQENERQEARWDAMADEAFEVNRLSGCLTDQDVLVATGCVG